MINFILLLFFLFEFFCSGYRECLYLSFLIPFLAQGEVRDDVTDVSQWILNLFQSLPADQSHQGAIDGRALRGHDVLLPRA